MSKGWQGKAKPKRVAGGQSWSGALLVPALVVLLLLGSLLVLAILMTRAPAAAAPAGSAGASSRHPTHLPPRTTAAGVPLTPAPSLSPARALFPPTPEPPHPSRLQPAA